MNLVELKKQLKDKKLDNLYVFTGEEVRIMEIFLGQISKATKKEICSLDTAASLYNLLGTKSFIKKPSIYVIRDDSAYIKQNDTVWNKVIKRSKKDTDIVIFIYSNLDKRGKFYKFFENHVVEFVKLSGHVVVNYLKKDFSLSTPNAESIVARCQSNYNMSLLECHKIKCLSEAYNIDIDSAYDRCVQANLLNKLSSEDVLQEFIECFMGKDFEQCLKLIRLLDEKTDPPLKVLIYLYNAIRALFNVVAYESGFAFKKNEICTNFWAIKNAEPYADCWKLVQVRNVMYYLQRLEMNIKLGIVPNERVLDLLIVQCEYISYGQDRLFD